MNGLKSIHPMTNFCNHMVDVMERNGFSFEKIIYRYLSGNSRDYLDRGLLDVCFSSRMPIIDFTSDVSI